MQIQLTSTQRDLLVQLLSDELQEIGPEIHHATISTYKHDLQAERRELRDLLDRMRVLTEDVARTPATPLAAPDAIGLA
jgi:hypothetical protein